MNMCAHVPRSVWVELPVHAGPRTAATLFVRLAFGQWQWEASAAFTQDLHIAGQQHATS